MSTNPIEKGNPFNQRQVKRIFYRRLGTVIWVSFLLACIQCTLFFAVFDPLDLALLSSFNFDFARMTGYAMGFLFFWFFTFLSCYFCGIAMVLPRKKLAKRTLNNN